MTERGAILSQQEVKAIMANRLILLVRPMKPQPMFNDSKKLWQWTKRKLRANWNERAIHNCPTALNFLRKYCPLGAPWDRLWGRETFAFTNSSFSGIKQDAPAFEYTHYEIGEPDSLDNAYRVVYRASMAEKNIIHHHWRPSTQMPKWAARIWLENAGVQVKRIQDITAKEIMKTDMWWDDILFPTINSEDKFLPRFAKHWDEHNPRHPWDSNPWAWLVGVKTLSTNGRPA